jgi:hypothetical protein
MTGADVPDLLSPMDADAFQAYHEALVRSVLPKNGALKVVPDVGGAGIGKGIVAARDYSAGSRIFTEPPLVRLQLRVDFFNLFNAFRRALGSPEVFP